MISPETVGITLTFKEPITFHLRLISIDEENQLRQKMFGLSEKEKTEKSYQNNVDLLADLSTKLPDGMFGDAVPKCPTDCAVREYFADKTVLKERLADYAVSAYFAKITPTIDFL